MFIEIAEWLSSTFNDTLKEQLRKEYGAMQQKSNGNVQRT